MAAESHPSKEIYTYEAPWSAYALAWSNREDRPFRLAVGSFVEAYSNKVGIIEYNEDSGAFETSTSFSHPYPATKIMFRPDGSAGSDLLATTGDYLRLWRVEEGGGGGGGGGGKLSSTSSATAGKVERSGGEGRSKGGPKGSGDKASKVKMVKLFNSARNTEFCAPLTSFDWNSADPNIVAASSIDTTITIWDIEKEKALTQLIAHDKEVYDVAFAQGSLSPHVFSSVGADGSIRMFDRRQLKHSTIIYETKGNVPLLRLAWNVQDPNYLACIKMDSSEVFIMDIRVPALAATHLGGHSGSVNSIAWAPHSSCHICTAGEDRLAYIWDVSSMPSVLNDPILCYSADDSINNLQWSASQPDWVAITYDDKVQMLHV